MAEQDLETTHSMGSELRREGQPTPSLADQVELEAFGVPGTEGRLAGPLATPAGLAFAGDAFWLASPPRDQDLHAGFLTDLQLREPGVLRCRVIAPAAYRLWINDEVIVTGPLRFAPSLPEYQQCEVELEAGRHRVSLQVHHEGLTTRLAAAMPAFVWIDLAGPLVQVPQWAGRALDEYLASGLRVSPLQGWMEWTSRAPAEAWRSEDPTRDERWREVVPVSELGNILGQAHPSPVQIPPWPAVAPTKVGAGRYRDIYSGYRFDDVAVQFLTADLSPDRADDADGTWERFDLGRIRIGSLEFAVESDAPGEVTVAYAERLDARGFPLPVVPNSAGPTRMMQKYAFGPGRTCIRPLQALGGRYVEVRLATPGSARVCEPKFRERDLLGPPLGSLTLDDPLLQRIWEVGLDTMRASTEDSVVDSVRERGEWIGDLSTVGIELLATGWGVTAPARRALTHAAATARADGMVSGCGPGELIYLGTFAAQWTSGCLRCAELEGSTDLLRELLEPARANMRALLACIGPGGENTLPWPFVDWGYRSELPTSDVAVLAHVQAALHDWIRWLRILGTEDTDPWEAKAKDLQSILVAAVRESPPGYHGAVLAERVGAIDLMEAVELVLPQFRTSFPFNPEGQRLRDPTKASSAIVTPFFSHYALDLVIRAGQTDTVLDFWRRGWGWMLQRGANTWWEVFDDRWSHCHYWAGSPTWQMSRHLLGLRPALRGAEPVVAVKVYPGSLPWARGTVPIPGVGPVEIEWIRDGASLRYSVQSPSPWVLGQGDARAVQQPAGAVTLRLEQRPGDHGFVPIRL